MNFLTPLAEYRPLVAAVALSGPHPPRLELLTPIPEQADSPDLATKIRLSCSSADSLGAGSADSAIHFVDEASGTVISRVQRASGSRILAEQFVLEPASLTSSLSLHIGSPPSCAVTDIDAHIESLPSFMLTLPTPISPQSPLFSPEDFTTEKLLNATELRVPRCDHVLGGKLCRACETHMLPCRARSQHAGGGAQELSPGYPAQSTAGDRAVRASMDVGASYPSGVGLGLTECWGEGNNDQDDDDDDIDDPGSLAIEALPLDSSRLALLGQRVKGILRKARVGFGLLLPSRFPLGNTRKAA